MCTMGNREDLLAGAKRCLLEKGYTQTRARDVANAAGVSLAAIGYHFGSLQELLNQAFMAAMEEWAEGIDPSDAPAPPDEPIGSIEQFEAFWTRAVQSFETNRPLVKLNFEMGLQGDHLPEVGKFLTMASRMGRRGFGKMFQGIDEDAEPDRAEQVGGFYNVMMSGLMVMWLIDPERAPDGHTFADLMRFVVRRMIETSGPDEFDVKPADPAGTTDA
jgi:AcrR family transcriptional regulator